MLGGLVFGCADPVLTWLDPVEDDSVTAVLRFYRPMLLMSAMIAFNAARASLMARFRASGVDNLRLFINLDYLKGTPFKLAAATTSGAICGGRGATVRWLVHPPQA